MVGIRRLECVTCSEQPLRVDKGGRMEEDEGRKKNLHSEETKMQQSWYFTNRTLGMKHARICDEITTAKSPRHCVKWYSGGKSVYHPQNRSQQNVTNTHILGYTAKRYPLLTTFATFSNHHHSAKATQPSRRQYCAVIIIPLAIINN